MPSTRPVFLLRLPPAVRARAEARATFTGLSLNARVAVTLDGYLGGGNWGSRAARRCRDSKRAVPLRFG
jgi:HicB family